MSMQLLTSLSFSMENFFNQVSDHSNISNKNTTAQQNTSISDGEKMFLTNRLPIVKASLEKILNRSLEGKKIPKIAFICSGGGYRAMLCTTGSLCGAHKIGLLDSTTYITALSGSTWTVAPWISIGLPIKKFKNYLQDCIAKPLSEFSLEEKNLMTDALHIKNKYNQSITLVDHYGLLLGNRLLDALGDQRQTKTLSDQAQKVESGAYPYPIYTAIDGREAIITGQTWYEFTPHTIGDRTNNIQIPTNTFGKKFKEGQLMNDTPEKPLAYCMGMWGSAFAANIHEILKEVVHNQTILNIITELLPTSIDGERLLPFWAKVPNHMYKMDNIQDTTLSNKKNIKLVDAGLEINLPYPPISGICPDRTADILIFLDSSAGIMGKELENVVAYAQKYNLPFPEIDFENIDKKTINIFKRTSQNPSTVIYLPAISDQILWEENKNKTEFTQYNLSEFDLNSETNNGFCETQAFQYTPEHSTLVLNQTEFNIRVNKDPIIKAINDWIDFY